MTKNKNESPKQPEPELTRGNATVLVEALRPVHIDGDQLRKGHVRLVSRTEAEAFGPKFVKIIAPAAPGAPTA